MPKGAEMLRLRSYLVDLERHLAKDRHRNFFLSNDMAITENSPVGLCFEDIYSGSVFLNRGARESGLRVSDSVSYPGGESFVEFVKSENFERCFRSMVIDNDEKVSGLDVRNSLLK